jgi:hypothetical protein
VQGRYQQGATARVARSMEYDDAGCAGSDTVVAGRGEVRTKSPLQRDSLMVRSQTGGTARFNVLLDNGNRVDILLDQWHTAESRRKQRRDLCEDISIGRPCDLRSR